MLCIYKRIGNSVIAPVVCKLAKELVRAAELSEQRQKRKRKKRRLTFFSFCAGSMFPFLRF